MPNTAGPNPRRRMPLLAGFALAAAFGATPALAAKHEFQMTIEERRLEIAPGFSAKVWAYNGQVPAPLIRVKEGDTVKVEVTNMTTLSHTIHWHGIFQTGSWRSDGVPNVTQESVEPGDSYTYEFIADKSGSLWYHCHVNVPEHVGVRGMWGPLVVDPKDPLPIEKEVTKEAILMFSGWNQEVAENYGQGGHPTEQMSYFSINGKSFPDTQPLRVKKGDVLRLRLYAPTSNVAFHLHGHDVLVTHKDGLPLESPYWADVVPMLTGERYDVIVRMDNPGRWMVHDHIDHHVSNNGKMPGGAMLVVEYEDVPRDEDWYVWKDKTYDPNFYWSESLSKGTGLFNHDAFQGAPLEAARPSGRKGRGRSSD